MLYHPDKLKQIIIDMTSIHFIDKQEAHGACDTRLVLTNPLGFVGDFYSTKFSIYLALAIMEQFKILYFYANVNCIV